MRETFEMAFLFWIIMDPIGNLPIFVNLLKHLNPQTQRRVIFRELVIALVILILILFFGYGFFQLINISQASLQISGGIILFIIAVRLIFASESPEKREQVPKDPFIVPLAVPAIAGPGILATITLYGAGVESNKWSVLAAIFIAWIFILPPLLFSPTLQRFLGKNGIVASEKLSGFLVVLISTEMTLNGLTTFLKQD